MAKRRGQGEGSIYKRKDGRWAATLELGYESGKRDRKTLYGRTQAEVLARLRAAQHGHAQGLPVAQERLTVGAFLRRWLDEAAKPALRPRVFSSYRQIVERHLAPAFGRTPLVKLTPDSIQAYMNRKTGGGLSA